MVVSLCQLVAGLWFSPTLNLRRAEVGWGCLLIGALLVSGGRPLDVVDVSVRDQLMGEGVESADRESTRKIQIRLCVVLVAVSGIVISIH